MLDDNEIMRVGGRLHNAAISYSEKHPMILPKINSKTNLDNSATAKLIEFTHKQTLHGGVTLTLAYLRQKYMIIGMRNSVKFCIQRCFTCKRFKTETLKQQMGTLPADRVNISLTFFHSSVDYAGPFNVKLSSIRRAKLYKCYIAVFVCLSTKAYHLELVSALTAEAFVEAFKRFIGRRGLVQMIRSDNGGNFVK